MMMESSINSTTILPPYEEEFEPVDNLHWSPETANSIYLFWIHQLQASNYLMSYLPQMTTTPLSADSTQNLRSKPMETTINEIQAAAGAIPKKVRKMTQAELIEQIAELQENIDTRLSKLELSHQPPRLTSTVPCNKSTPKPSTAPMNMMMEDRPTTEVTIRNLQAIPEVKSSLAAQLDSMPIIGHADTRILPDRPNPNEFYRSSAASLGLLQDHDTAVPGKPRKKSGMDLESQENIVNTVYWPHAFTSEIAHIVKNRKAQIISQEAFILGAVNILMQPDTIVPLPEKLARLKLLHGIEVGSHTWTSSFENLSHFTAVNDTNSTVSSNSFNSAKIKQSSNANSNTPRIQNIICYSYNYDKNVDTECAFSRDGKQCQKIHVCLACAKNGYTNKHPEKLCEKSKSNNSSSGN
ncbi:hypothetical protein LOTGIDRAFT_157137 [Lottia gigantea]|uniref:Uncharacterized protein n=1 Tax=Lottia gigantea TaxID=225164 RepID=V4CIK3_LOTGI|nr:hypothetical protein LOTGIDRAFT_157137 [Lottia gigantea]ESP02000.1 hypothetical protein LOTGIDRAFT_157137 [Lottia gigantea]